MKRVIIFSLALIVLLTAGSLFAQPPGVRGNRSDMPDFRRGTALDLSAEQQTKIDKLRLDLQKMAAPLRADVQSLQTAYRLMIIDPKVSESKLKTQLGKISAKRQALALLRAKHQRQIRSLLTDEQKVKFDQRIISGHGKKGRMGHKGGKMRKGGRKAGSRMR